jgi:hypothetical protein
VSFASANNQAEKISEVMDTPNNAQKKFLIALASVVIASILLAVLAYQLTLVTLAQTRADQARRGPQGLQATSTAVAASSSTPSPLSTSALNPGSVLGIDSGPPSLYPGISWSRVNYTTCGAPQMAGSSLKSTIQLDHLQGVHALLLLCQQPGNLLNMQVINDVASAGADAVECGNEQMKHNTYSTYVPPDSFARFFDLCERAVHAVSPNIPVLLGSLDPQVGGVNYQPLADQVGYLDAVQNAMNTSVHPGANWSWRAQTLGLIDSWHNGFPNQSVNSLGALFVYWAQQFHVGLNNGELGRHLWVVEGTGCIYGCGLNSTYEISVAHILTLITDVQTAMRYHIPFFYFSGKDFFQQNQSAFWPMGVLDVNGNAKPLRQDLSLGARTLDMSCPNGSVQVIDQEQLLAKLYRGCMPPSNYVSILAA